MVKINISRVEANATILALLNGDPAGVTKMRDACARQSQACE